MRSTLLAGAALVAATAFATPLPGTPAQPVKRDVELLTDIDQIMEYWGQGRPYKDNVPGYFGVEDTGMPNGCGVEKVFQLHRHGARYGTDAFDDADNDSNFAAKLVNFTKAGGKFSGALDFLSGYSYRLSSSGLLVSTGAAQEFTSGTQFWNLYGRLLLDAQPGQPYYNASFLNGTARPKPQLRTTSQARILQSAEFWAQGFFGFQSNVSSLYDLVVIPEQAYFNNTLSSYESCATDYNDTSLYYKGDYLFQEYIPVYLKDATERLSQYFDGDFSLTTNDTYAMQHLCSFEYAALGSSDFCGLFTEDEWKGYEYTLDVEYYYDYAFGNPTGRAQGVGYVQELFARLNQEYITSTETSVNVTYDNNGNSFLLDQPFYLDMSHDDILISVLVALSFDYLKGDLPVDASAYPPNPDRHFKLSHLTPFGARLTTEIIGCASENPTAKPNPETYYTQSTNGYDASNASNKFIRMRLNNAPLPLETIRGGFCEGRTDGMCPLDKFVASQANITELANYQYVCFGNLTEIEANFNGDGTAFAA